MGDGYDNQSSSSIGLGISTVDEQIAELRPVFQRKLSGEGTAAPRQEDVAEAITQLLVFAMSIERVISSAEGGDGRKLPGQDVPVRVFVDQVLNGEAPESARRRLTDWIRQAIGLLSRSVSSVDHALDRFAYQLADELNPAKIENKVEVGTLQKMIGRTEVVYWRHYKSRWKNLDAQGLKEIAAKGRTS